MSCAEPIRVDVREMEVMVRRVLSERAGRPKAFAPPIGAGSGLWSLMAELGWLSLPAPQALGGLEQPFEVIAVVYKEIGRSLLGEPVMATLMAADALRLTTQVVREELLRSICEGRIRVALPLAPTEITVQAHRTAEALKLTGTAPAVLYAEGATHVLLRVGLEGRSAWLLAPLPGAHPPPCDIPIWDTTRQISALEFDGCPVSADFLVAEGAAAMALDDQLAAHFDLAVACDSVGGARRLLDETISYMKTREQFGRPIGSFQALKHRCATLHSRIEAAEALADEAVAEHQRTGAAGTLAAASKLYATNVYRETAIEAVQLHGGIGFTWEHDCHRYLKRALFNEQFGRPPRAERDRIAGSLLGGER